MFALVEPLCAYSVEIHENYDDDSHSAGLPIANDSNGINCSNACVLSFSLWLSYIRYFSLLKELVCSSSLSFAHIHENNCVDIQPKHPQTRHWVMMRHKNRCMRLLFFVFVTCFLADYLVTVIVIFLSLCRFRSTQSYQQCWCIRIRYTVESVTYTHKLYEQQKKLCAPFDCVTFIIISHAWLYFEQNPCRIDKFNRWASGCRVNTGVIQIYTPQYWNGELDILICFLWWNELKKLTSLAYFS